MLVEQGAEFRAGHYGNFLELKERSQPRQCFARLAGHLRGEHALQCIGEGEHVRHLVGAGFPRRPRLRASLVSIFPRQLRELPDRLVDFFRALCFLQLHDRLTRDFLHLRADGRFPGAILLDPRVAPGLRQLQELRKQRESKGQLLHRALRQEAPAISLIRGAEVLPELLCGRPDCCHAGGHRRILRSRVRRG